MKKIPGKVFHFLSFTDAFEYLQEDLNLKGETLLVPGFYCEHTMRKYQENLKVIFCDIDQALFDIDYKDFVDKLQKNNPRVIIIYNFFGKKSILYHRTDWLQHISPNTVIISDFAHSVLYDHSITFFNSHHFYIDSARKCTPFMVSNLATPIEYPFERKKVRQFSFYKIKLRLLFCIKNWLLLLAYATGMKRFLQLGVDTFLRHDSLVGESPHPTGAFEWDSLLFKYIAPQKVRRHKVKLYQAYKSEFKKYSVPEIHHFPIPAEEWAHLCFYFIAVPEESVKPLCKYTFERGVVIDQLWNVKSIDGLPEHLKRWGSQIVVLPYTNLTSVRSIAKTCRVINNFFSKTC